MSADHIKFAADHLERHGLSWLQLEALARKALHDAMSERGSTLDEERLEVAAKYLFDVGLEWAGRYDSALAEGVSFATSAYRRMRRRYRQFLRDAPRFGFAGTCDTRRGRPLVVTAVDQIPESEALDPETFEQAAEHVSRSLSTRALWTLRHLAQPIAEDGLTLDQAARGAKIEVGYAGELLEELGWQLGRAPVEDATSVEAWAGCLAVVA